MRALVVGRFQPLHKGHVALLKQAQEECVRVAVAVGSTQAKPSLRNPFTALERRQMLAAVFPTIEVFEVPDLHDPARWAAHCLSITGKVDKVYGNDDSTLDLFEMEGLPVVRPGLVHREEYEASAIRAQMAEGDRVWMKSVPQPVVELLLGWDAPRRLLQLDRAA